MAAILHLSRQLTGQPPLPVHRDFAIRTFAGSGDIAPWLPLRDLAFASESPAPGAWEVVDFEREFLTRWWWQPERMWLAFANPEPERSPGQPIGSVTLAQRGAPENSLPAVHWLMVCPEWRRRGVADALMAHLERACWAEGRREIVLETHARWSSAVAFYRARGYA